MDLVDPGTFSQNFNNDSFIMLLANFFLNFMQGFKSATLEFFHFWQNGTFEPCMKFKKKFAKSILLKHYETIINQMF
jgi:hypothetical protein